MTTLYLIHGFVGTGKTTFSKKLEQEVNAVRFSPDEWVLTLYDDKEMSSDDFAAQDKKIKAMIWTVAQRLLQTGTSVILDYGFWKKADRDDYRARGKALNVDVKLYNLECPEDIMLQRVLKRTADMPDGALFIDRNAIEIFKHVLSL